MRAVLASLSLILFLLVTSDLGAQPGNPATADTASLRVQFDDMVRVSNRYQQFRVVRRSFLNAFIANVSDTISGYTSEIAELKRTIATQNSRIEEQAGEIEVRDQDIVALQEDKESISLLGLDLTKTTYSLIMWALVIGLLAALVLALGSTRVAVSDSSGLKRERDKLSEELEQSRKSRLKVEQDLRRRLQDELNRRGEE